MDEPIDKAEERGAQLAEGADDFIDGMIAVGKLMGRNLIWYVPCLLFVLGFLVIPTVVTEYQMVLFVLRYKTWDLLWSICTWLFVCLLTVAPIAPLKAFLPIPLNFIPENPAYRYRTAKTFAQIVLVVFIGLLFRFLLWGCLPKTVGPDGVVQTRIIPFVPMPVEGRAPTR